MRAQETNCFLIFYPDKFPKFQIVPKTASVVFILSAVYPNRQSVVQCPSSPLNHH